MKLLSLSIDRESPRAMKLVILKVANIQILHKQFPEVIKE